MDKSFKWSDKGAVIEIKYDSLKITRLSDNKTIVLNGKINITNASGGRLANIQTANVIHLMNSPGMTITFEDGLTRSWQIAVQRVYSFENGVVITTTGTHTDGTRKNISAWGKTRTGRDFTSVIEEPMIIRGDCHFRLVSAKLVQHQSQTLTIIFGLNANGNPTSCPANDPYYFKVAWQGQRNIVRSFLMPY
jgi:hypothetical protein